MPREPRLQSESGIYHVMLRGINQQQIFEDSEDNQMFLQALKDCKQISRFKLLAYCLMGNHVHLLLQTEGEPLAQSVKRLCGRSVYWYNAKYQRFGHLFQDRFKSEPVDNEAYLFTVLRYIHQNPVKAGICRSASEYPYSSYTQYAGDGGFVDTAYVFTMISKDALLSLCNDTDQTETCLDVEDRPAARMTDEAAIGIIRAVSGCEHAADVQRLPPGTRNQCLRLIKKQGVSIRQLSRLTGISYYLIQKA